MCGTQTEGLKDQMNSLLALAQFCVGEYVSAEESLETAYQTHRKKTLPDKDAALIVLHMLGCTLHIQGKYKKAHQVFGKVHKARLTIHGDNNEQTSFSAKCLALAEKARYNPMSRMLLLSNKSCSIPIRETAYGWETIPELHDD
ncbi:hypothetical protein BJY01DRAFT_255517 [Aspergillus pseudoustus]|uniref:Uncharacterized protein n=1 Tax=Aspergillus pseudoustus TaxID=1810923 RepID=A0ABR4IL23_9EURO